jgi:hypothetical protein
VQEAEPSQKLRVLPWDRTYFFDLGKPRKEVVIKCYKLESHKTSIVSFFFAREALIPSWDLSWMVLKVSSVISA